MNLKSVTEGILFVVGDEGITLTELSEVLTVNEDDWKIRCKYSNEPDIDYNEHSKAFAEAAQLHPFQIYPFTHFNTNIPESQIISTTVQSNCCI